MQSNLEKQRIENYYKAQKIIKNLNATSMSERSLLDYTDCIIFLKKAIPYRDSQELFSKYQEEIITFIKELGIDDNDYTLEEFKDALDCVEDDQLVDVAKQCFQYRLQTLYQYALQLDKNFDIENASDTDIEHISCLFENLSSFEDVDMYLEKYNRLQDERKQKEIEEQYQKAISILNYEDSKIKKICAQKNTIC